MEILNFLDDSKSLSTCRFCLCSLFQNNVEEDSRVVFIDDKIRLDFFDATSMQLLSSPNFSDLSCFQCIQKLKTTIANIRDFTQVQKDLYSKFPPVKMEIEEFKFPAIELEEETDEKCFTSNMEGLDVQMETFSAGEESELKLEKPIKTKKKAPLKKTRHKQTRKVDKSKITTTCPDCGIVLKMGSLRKHQKNMHLKQKNFICDHCDRAFFLKTRLLNHLRSHFQIKPFRCPQCDWRFTSAGALFSHKKKVHEKAYTRCCHLCGKEFSCKTLFDTHMRSSHTGERPYPCDIEGCEQRFFSAAELAVHKKGKHAENDPVRCEICNKTLKYAKLLKIHMKIHQERKFVCDFIIEDGGKKCGKRFITNHLLSNHIKLSHLGLKRFECNLCNMKFSVRIDMDNHNRNIHQKVKIQCELCQTLLGDKSYYQRHVKTHHSDVQNSVRDALIYKIKCTKDDDLFNYRK